MGLVQTDALLRGVKKRAEALDLLAQGSLPLAGRFQLIVDRATRCGIEVGSGDLTDQPVNLRAANTLAERPGELGINHLRQAAEFPLDHVCLPYEHLENTIFGTLGVDEVVTVHLRFGLELAINAAIALLQTVGIPGHVKVEQVPAVCLQVEAFAGSVSGDEDTNRVFVGGGVERLPD